MHKVESESELQLVSGVECPEEAISLNAGERVTLRLRTERCHCKDATPKALKVWSKLTQSQSMVGS